MNETARNWPIFTVELSTGKSLKIKAPSPQRAFQRAEREIAKRGLAITVTGVR